MSDIQASVQQALSQLHYQYCNWWLAKGLEKPGKKFRECDCINGPNIEVLRTHIRHLEAEVYD